MTAHSVFPALRIVGPWAEAAACRGHGELFGSSWRHDQDAAVIICATCPVMAECAAHAKEHHEIYGVWGGRRPDQRYPHLWKNVVRRMDRRRVAVSLFGTGVSIGEIARALSVTKRSVHRYVHG